MDKFIIKPKSWLVSVCAQSLNPKFDKIMNFTENPTAWTFYPSYLFIDCSVSLIPLIFFFLQKYYILIPGAVSPLI